MVPRMPSPIYTFPPPEPEPGNAIDAATQNLLPHEAQGQGSRTVLRADDQNRLLNVWRRILASKSPSEIEVRIRDFDGEYRSFLISAVSRFQAEGKVPRCGRHTDIENHKQPREITSAQPRDDLENLELREAVEDCAMFEDIVGSSEPIKQVAKQVVKVASSDATVLLLGETGTGKELLARALHSRSLRSAKPFIAVNCAAIPPSLINSELFGHEKGAFTGALQRRLGRFESAAGGTLFLDEVGELPAETQIALLRVLQEREIERLGSNHPITVSVRVIAATNRNLDECVVQGTFRQDLFYRLNVFPIQVPSLRERADDIPILIRHFVERYGTAANKHFSYIEKRTLKILKSYDWPGNIRELQNIVERAVILCEGETFHVDESWLTRKSVAPPLAVKPLDSVAEIERDVIEDALTKTRGRIGGPAGAAALLKVPRQTLEYKLVRLGVNKYHFKTHAMK
jgi:formate hydrogenlyase transcriptional activator